MNVTESLSKLSFQHDSLEGQLPEELIHNIFAFLPFQSIAAMNTTSKAWLSHCNKELEACQRYPYNPMDVGTGIGIPLDLESRADWKKACLAREQSFFDFDKEETSEAKVASILHNIVRYRSNKNYVEESLRWITYLFDQSEMTGAVELPKEVIANLVSYLEVHTDNAALQQLGAKAVGIVALNEKNRESLAEVCAIRVLLTAVKNHLAVADVMTNVCWALVICARPIGAMEGSPFQQGHMRNTTNINSIVDLGGIDAVLNIIQTHKDKPSTMAKAFWCMVNLSLYEGHKQAIVEKRGVEIILEALRNFPSNRELQYRACFAIINLAIKPDVKEKIRELNGIALVLEGMRTFPDCALFQRCATVVLRSLAWKSEENCRIIRQLQGEAVIKAMMKQFKENRDMKRLGKTALQCLAMSH